MAVEIDLDKFETEILQSKEPVAVDFWGPQCGPCLKLLPVVEQLEKDYAGRVKIAKVNAATNRLLCARLRVLGLPTFIFYQRGNELNRLTGDKITKNDLINAIERLLN